MSVSCCPLESGDGDGPWFLVTKTVTARKPHQCGECGGAIAPRDRYEHTTGCWDGQVSVSKTCLSCVEIRDHFACSGWIYGQVWADLQENFFPDMKAGGPCMEGLSPAAKARLFERRMAWYEGQQ